MVDSGNNNPCPTDTAVADDVVLRRSLHDRRRALEIFGVGFHAVGVLEEDSVSAANRHLTVAARIPGESETRRRIEQVPAQATARNAVDAALHHAVKRISRIRDKSTLLAGDARRQRQVAARSRDCKHEGVQFEIR